MMMRRSLVLVGKRSRLSRINHINQSICCHAGFARVSVSTLLSTCTRYIHVAVSWDCQTYRTYLPQRTASISRKESLRSYLPQVHITHTYFSESSYSVACIRPIKSRRHDLPDKKLFLPRAPSTEFCRLLIPINIPVCIVSIE
jgi:hypothetical protein